jgi:microcystin-dependent protein
MAIVWVSGMRMTGLAADTKPTNVQTSCEFYETDTFLTFVFNGSTWDQAGGAGAETGAIEPYGGDYDAIPSGWLICDGLAVSRTTYADLFAVVGTSFGVGDGSTTFNVPDLRDKFPKGAPNATDPGTTGGSNTVTLSTSELPVHSHSVNNPSHSHSYTRPSNASNYGQYNNSKANTSSGSTTGGATQATTVGNAGSGGAHENKPSFQEVVWMIKT